jgi:hypothetical protein
VILVEDSAAAATPTPAAPDAGPALEGEIVVTTDVDQPVIEVDGQVVARFARRAVVPVAIGRHDVRVTAAGRKPFHTRVEVAARVRLEVHAVLDPAEKRVGDKARRVRALYQSTGEMAQSAVARRDDDRSRALEAEFLAIPSPFLIEDSAALARIESRLRRLRRKLSAR